MKKEAIELYKRKYLMCRKFLSGGKCSVVYFKDAIKYVDYLWGSYQILFLSTVHVICDTRMRIFSSL